MPWPSFDGIFVIETQPQPRGGLGARSSAIAELGLARYSPPMSLFIAISAVIFGLMAAYTPNDASSPYSFITYGIAVWCFAIAGTCLTKNRLRNFFGSFVATGVVIGCLVNFVRTVDSVSTTSLADSGINMAIAVLVLGCFGWPATKYIRNVRFGYVEPPHPIKDQISVEFDDAAFRVHHHDGEVLASSEHFEWKDVTRVCFVDEGIYQSDLILIEIRDRENPVVIPIEGAGGTEFFGKLCDGGLFPEQVWRKAIGETGGRAHCWPPHETDATR